MMVPVLGIGPAFQGPVGKGLGFKQQKGQGSPHGRLGFVDHEEEEVAEAGERHSGGGVVMWHAGEAGVWAIPGCQTWFKAWVQGSNLSRSGL
jgi:hypothetical protein